MGEVTNRCVVRVDTNAGVVVVSLTIQNVGVSHTIPVAYPWHAGVTH